MTAFRQAALPGIVALAMLPMSTLAEPSIEALFEITLDIDHDGKPDRAVAVEETETGQGDLYIYLAAGAEKTDLSRQPSFLKRAVTEGSISGLESNAGGTLVVTSCFGCGASKSWVETLTIIHRAGEFLVAAYARDWDWNSHMADGSVETILGSCEIDFLSGKGVASDGLDEGKPIEAQFTPVKLADWSDDKRPAACNFF
jgi:hypothetical protein